MDKILSVTAVSMISSINILYRLQFLLVRHMHTSSKIPGYPRDLTLTEEEDIDINLKISISNFADKEYLLV